MVFDILLINVYWVAAFANECMCFANSSIIISLGLKV